MKHLTLALNITRKFFTFFLRVICLALFGHYCVYLQYVLLFRMPFLALLPISQSSLPKYIYIIKQNPNLLRQGNVAAFLCLSYLIRR